MNWWSQLWHQRVAAVRPYWFVKALLLIVGIDSLMLMSVRGSRYGLDNFYTAQFPWIDAIHLQPNYTYYTGVLVVVSFLAFWNVFAGFTRPALGLLMIVYTYSWMMSRHDSFMHHYLVSLAMLCMLFYPKITARDIIPTKRYHPGDVDPGARGNQAQEAKAERYAWRYVATMLGFTVLYLAEPFFAHNWGTYLAFLLGLVIISTMYFRTGVRSTSGVSAWAFRLSGAAVGVVYVFTTLAKCDTDWLGGFTVPLVGTTEVMLVPVQQIAAQWMGVPKEWFWIILSAIVLPLEAALALGYMAAIRQDEPQRKLLRWVCIFIFILANSLHLNNEMMELSIQWFGYYMIFLAWTFLLPETWSATISTLVVQPARWWSDQLDRWEEESWSPQSRQSLAALLFVAVAMLIGVGAKLDLPGSFLALSFVGVAIAIVILLVATFASAATARRYAVATTVSSLAMLAVVELSSTQFEYYDLQGRTYQQIGNPYGAVDSFAKAEKYLGRDAHKQAQFHSNYAMALRQMGSPAQSAKHYRQALALDSDFLLAHYNFGNLLRAQGELAGALYQYEQTLRIDPKFVAAQVNSAAVLASLGKFEEAGEFARQALRLQPDAGDAHYILALSLDANGQHEEALRHYKAAGAEPLGDRPGDDSGNKEGGNKEDGGSE